MSRGDAPRIPRDTGVVSALLLASASLLFLLRHVRSGRPVHLRLSLLFLGLTALTKVLFT